MFRKTLKCIAVLVFGTFSVFSQDVGQWSPCDIYKVREARSYFVIHNPATPASHRKKIEKAMSQADDIDRSKQSERADFFMDYTEPLWLVVWRKTEEGQREEIARWTLEKPPAVVRMPATARTTVIHAGPVTTARTVVTPSTLRTINTPGDINAGSEFLFQLRAGRKLLERNPDACN